MVGGPVSSEQDGFYCGVTDYAGRLATALIDTGLAAEVTAPPNWGLVDGLAFLRGLRKQRPDIVHLQYPSIGHRHSLLPHALGLAGAGRRFVVTLHEHSALPRLQQTANALFRMTADEIVFTTDYESRAFGAALSSPVIPIGSNVPVHPGKPDRGDMVLYFGQVRPNKGIEAFIALARLSNAANEPGRFTVIGSAPPRWRDYGRALRACAPANMGWVENASFAAVAEAMATAMAAFLPFPDGAGLRRGSVMAALANGLPVIAPTGASTTEELHAVLFPAETPQAALLQLRLLRSNPALGLARAKAGRALVRRFAWATIAEQHVALYMGLLGIPGSTKLGGLTKIDESETPIFSPAAST